MDQDKSHVLNINSDDRTSGVPEDFIVHLNENELHETTYVRLKDVTFANTMYNINAGNNELKWVDSLNNPYSLIVPIGHYSSAELVTYINNETKTNVIYATSPIQFVTNSRLSKFNILNSYLVSAVTFYVLPTSTILDVIGFINPSQILALSHLGGQPYNLLVTKFVHILSSKLAENDALIASNNKKYPVIATIPIEAPFGFLVTKTSDTTSNDDSYHNSNVNLSTVDIRLVDDNFKTINLNGSKVYLNFVINRH